MAGLPSGARPFVVRGSSAADENCLCVALPGAGSSPVWVDRGYRPCGSGAWMPTMTEEAPSLWAPVTGNDVDAIDGSSGPGEPGWTWPPYAPVEPAEAEPF